MIAADLANADITPANCPVARALKRRFATVVRVGVTNALVGHHEIYLIDDATQRRIARMCDVTDGKRLLAAGKRVFKLPHTIVLTQV